MTSNEELRKAMCLAAVLAEAVGAERGAECAASVVGTMRLLDEEVGEGGDTLEVMRRCVEHRRERPRSYGDEWRRIRDAKEQEQLALRAAEAWDTGMVPV